MNLPEFAIRKKVTISMVTLGLVLLGILFFMRLPQELFPPLTFPQITIVTEYSNAAPEEIETLITKPIEEAVGSVSGLKEIRSVSREGRSMVLVAFNWGQDIEFAALAVREKIDLIKEKLPKEAEDPVVLKFDPLTRPIMVLSVTGPQLDPAMLKLLTEKMLKDNLEKVLGVASATVSGGVNREILVEVDQARLQANHLSLLEVVESLEKANISYPAGSIKKGLYEYLIRTMGEFNSVKEIEYTVLATDEIKKSKRVDTSFVERGSRGPRDTVDTLREEVDRAIMEKRLVFVREIGSVIDGFAERTSVSRYNGKADISVSIQKQAGANTIQVVDRLINTLDLLREDLESRGLHYKIIYDHSVFIRNSLHDLVTEGLMGGLLAFLTLYFFLRSSIMALLTTVSIPLTIMGVFPLMAMQGISINMMSIGGLVLGIGMIVDTSIVVIENIFRMRQGGENAERGAILGATEVIWPVVASNLACIAVFIPLIILVPGIPGQLFKDLSWTIIFSQILSTFIPLTTITMLTTFVNIHLKEYKPFGWTGMLEKRLFKPGMTDKRQNWFFARIVIVAVAVCLLSIPIFKSLDVEALPKVDQGQFLVTVDMPIGTRLEVTDRVVSRLEKLYKDTPAVKDVAVSIGSEKGKRGDIKVETLRPSQAQIVVSLKKQRKKSSAAVVEMLREKTKELELEHGQINYILQESEFQFAEGSGKPVMIEIKGYDMEGMRTLVDQLKVKLAQVPGIADIQDDLSQPTKETKVKIEKDRAALYGISAMDISLTARAAIDGVVSTEYREGGKEFDVRVRLSEKDRENVENLNQLLLYSRVLDTVIPLKEVATITQGLGPSEIRRQNQERTAIISADILKKYQSKEVISAVQKMLKSIPAESEFRIALSGRAREIKENFNKVFFAAILAVLLTYMIMASQFESFMQPLIIMGTVPLAVIGVAVALWVTGTTLNVISLLGLVILAGVVVNNGIVLIEFINQLRERGMGVVEAAIEAAKIRTRPILMSAMTSALGLVPLALGLGEGSELRAPLAVTTMGGLLTSTFLTLVVIPSLYVLVTRLTERFYIEEEEAP